MNANKLIAIAVVTASAVMAADRTVTENWTLTQDETVDGTLILPTGVIVNLDGHRLTAKGLSSGSAPILADNDSVQYEQLEYVMVTGTQNVPTTYTPATTDRAEMQIEFTDASSGFLFCTRDKDAKHQFGCYRENATEMRYDLGSGSTSVGQSQAHLKVSTTANGNRYFIVLHGGTPNNGTVKGTGLVRANDADAASFASIEITKYSLSPVGPFNLFSAVKWNGGAVVSGSIAAYCKGKFFRFTVKDVDGTTVKCDIVPAKRVSDGLVGLFDIVAKKFLPPNGTFTQYGEMEAEGGTITSDNFSHAADLTVNEPSRVSCNYTSFAMNGYTASVLFNNNYTRQGDASHRLILNLNADATPHDTLPIQVDYDFGDGTPQVVNSYRLWFGTAGAGYIGRAPKAWTLYGSNDKTEWTPLDVRTSETGWAYNDQARTYSFLNDVPYRWYRLEITATNGGDGYMELTQIEYFRSGRICIDVPAGETAENQAISFTGGVQIEKDGPGTLKLTKENYGFGGSRITTLFVKNGKVTRPANTIRRTLGLEKSTVAVLSGGQFELGGFNYYDYDYIIAGAGPDGRGALVNDTFVAGYQNQGTWYAAAWNGFMRNVTLADDATIGGRETFGMLYYAATTGGSYASGEMFMNGKTLTYADEKSTYSWSMYNYNGEGAINIAENATFAITMGDASRQMSAPGCDMTVAGTLDQNGLSAVVKSLSFTATGNYTHMNAKPITVHEKYAPNINSTAGKNKHPTVTLGAAGHTNTVLDLSLFSGTFDSSFTTFHVGSAVTVDTGTRELVDGGKLVSWTAQPNATFTLKDGDALGFEVVALSDGLYLKLVATPAYATWDVEAAQWRYFTSDDVELPSWTGGIANTMEVRFGTIAEYEAITNAVEVSGIAPGAFVLTSLPLAEGSAEVDLTDLNFTVTEGVVIDVKGNSLKLPNSAIGWRVEFTVTSSVAGGKLVVDVPRGATVENTSVTLGGLLRLVKRGEGTFVPTKLYQSYTGGNEIAAGTVKLSTAHNQADGYFNELGGFVQGTGSYADVEILPGATVDQNGQTGLRSYNFILKGGTLTNTTTDFGTNLAMFFRIALRDAERSYFTLPAGISTGFYADLNGETTLDLGGKTLQLAIAGSRYFYLNNTTISNGTLDVVAGGMLRTMRTPSNARYADINLNAALWLDQDLSVNNFVVKYPGDWDQGKAVLKVYGAFRPEAAGGYFYGPTMQDGSTLDFSAWNVAELGFPVYSRSVRYQPCTNITFAADAKVVGVKLNPKSEAVKTLARRKDEPCYLLRWDEETAPDASLKFELDAESRRFFKLRRKEDGLVLDFNSSLIIYVR